MRVWTVQPAVVWEQLQQHGSLAVDEARLVYVPEAYRWLQVQLRQRLPGYAGGPPWWAYCEKRDLRWARHHRPAGSREVRIELEPAPGTFLAFPCWAWNVVYGGQYLSFEAEEAAAWNRARVEAVPDEDLWPLPEPWKTELETSWLRLFNPALPGQTWDRESLCVDLTDSREAVVGLLRIEEVRRVTPFIGANKRWFPRKA